MNLHQIVTEFRGKLNNTNGKKITRADIENFYSKLDTIKKNQVLFSKYHRKYIDNLIRLKPDLNEQNPDLTLLKVALSENEWKPTKMFDIFIHYLKYTNGVTSKFFIKREKKQNHKKLNNPKAKAEVSEKPKAEKEWIRVPIPRHHPRKK